MSLLGEDESSDDSRRDSEEGTTTESSPLNWGQDLPDRRVVDPSHDPDSCSANAPVALDPSHDRHDSPEEADEDSESSEEVAEEGTDLRPGVLSAEAHEEH